MSETLVLHGGTCPNCFGEIPGEETPTDPGEEVKAEILQADQAHARRQNMKPLLVMAPLVLGVLAFAGWKVFGPEPEMPALVLDDSFLDGIQFEFAEYEEPEPEAAVEQVAAVRKVKRPKTGSRLEKQIAAGKTGVAAPDNGVGSLSGGAVAKNNGGPGGRTASSAGQPAGGKMPNQITAMRVGSDQAGMMEPVFGARRTAALLTEESDIKSAIRDLWKQKGPTLVQCYEQQLKSNEDLRGQWKIDFTIGTDGHITKTNARGVTMQHPALEACIKSRMSKWAIYGRLPKARPVTLPVKFGL